MCVCVCVCVCICIYIFFIHLSVDGHLGCFHVFGIVISFPSDIYPEVESLDHMVVLILIFLGTPILFSIVALPIYIPTNNAQGFPFLYIFTNTCYFLSF